jgi:hypothetical protein
VTAHAQAVRAVAPCTALQSHLISVFQPFSSQGENAITSEITQVIISLNLPISPEAEMAIFAEIHLLLQLSPSMIAASYAQVAWIR